MGMQIPNVILKDELERSGRSEAVGSDGDGDGGGLVGKWLLVLKRFASIRILI